MSVLVVGMSHQSAPVALLEKLSMDDVVQHSACGRLVDTESLTEAMIISTCNRLEVYTVTNSFHTGVQDVIRVLQEVSARLSQALRPHELIGRLGGEEFGIVYAGSRDEVRAFLNSELPADIAAKTRLGKHLSKEDHQRWQQILVKRGWYAPGWPSCWR